MVKDWEKETMKNNLGDLNNYLFEELERLNDDESLASDTDFEKELKRSRAITDVAGKIIDNASTVIKAVAMSQEYGTEIAPMLQIGTKSSNNEASK